MPKFPRKIHSKPERDLMLTDKKDLEEIITNITLWKETFIGILIKIKLNFKSLLSLVLF